MYVHHGTKKETRTKYVQHHTVQTRFPIKDQILFIIAAGILFVLQLMFGIVRVIFMVKCVYCSMKESEAEYHEREK